MARMKRIVAEETTSGMQDTPENTTLAPIQTEENVSIPKSTLQSLLSRLDAVEKGQGTPKKNKKDKYTGPLTMKYAYYAKNEGDGVALIPILAIQPFSPEPDMDLVYKNQYGQYTENQQVKLTLADSTTVKVTIEKMKHLKPSESKTPLYVEDEFGNKVKGDTPAGRDVAILQRAKVYTFDDPIYGEIRVASNCINIA